MLSSGESDDVDAKVLSEGMPLGEMEVVWGDGKLLFYYVVQKAQGQ